MARFGSFGFLASEEPVADTGWSRPKATVDDVLCVGAAQDSVITLGIGSKRRTVEMYMTPARIRMLEWYINMDSYLEDWEVVPLSDPCLMTSVEIVEGLNAGYGTATGARRIRIEFLSRVPP